MVVVLLANSVAIVLLFGASHPVINYKYLWNLCLVLLVCGVSFVCFVGFVVFSVVCLRSLCWIWCLLLAVVWLLVLWLAWDYGD